jgi:uncharacterized protein YegL
LNNPTTDVNGVTETDSFDVSVADGDGVGQTVTVTIGIADDAPIAYNNAVSLVEGSASSAGTVTNVLLVLDMSGSMQGTNFVNMKTAVSALADKYEANGGIHATIVTFGGRSVDNGEFLNAADIKTWFDGIANTSSAIDVYGPGNGTNYQAAIADATAAWDGTTLNDVTSSNSIAYFISDGEPSNNKGLTSSQVTNWETYVESNFTKAIAVGFGSGAPNDTDLKTVAHTPGGVDEIYTPVSLAEFIANLEGTVVPPVVEGGNVVTESGMLSLTDISGADGWATPKLVSVTESNGVTVHSFNNADTSFTIVTNAGTVVINDDGSYTFTSLSDVADNVTDSITYTVADSDGSTASAELILITTDSSELIAVADTVTVVSTTIEGEVSYAQETGTWGAGTLTSTTIHAHNGGGGVPSTSAAFTVGQAGSAVSVKLSMSDVSNNDTVIVALNDGQSITLTYGQADVWGWGGYEWQDSTSSNVSWNSNTGVITFRSVAQGSHTMTVTADDNSYDSYEGWFGEDRLDVVASQLHYVASQSGPDTTTSNQWGNVGMTAAAIVEGIISGELFANDSLGSEGATITALSHDGTLAEVTIGQQTVIAGLYGVLTVDNATGEYIYVPVELSTLATVNAALDVALQVATDGQSDVFSYTLTQADGDSDTTDLTINYGTGDGTAGADTLTATATVALHGDEGNDHLIGSAGADMLFGDGGSDTLEGGDGEDHLYGGAGNDALFGGADADTLVGGAGNDILTGGEGADIFVWNDGDVGTVATPAYDVVTDFNPDEDQLDLSDMLTGTSNDIADYITVTADGNGDAVLNVTPAGDESGVTQQILLQGIQASSFDASTIDTLIGSGHIIINDVL